MSNRNANIDKLFKNRFESWEAPYDPSELQQSFEQVSKQQMQNGLEGQSGGGSGTGSGGAAGSGMKGLFTGIKGWVIGGMSAVIIGAGAGYWIAESSGSKSETPGTKAEIVDQQQGNTGKPATNEQNENAQPNQDNKRGEIANNDAGSTNDPGTGGNASKSGFSTGNSAKHPQSKPADNNGKDFAGDVTVEQNPGGTSNDQGINSSNGGYANDKSPNEDTKLKARMPEVIVSRGHEGTYDFTAVIISDTIVCPNEKLTLSTSGFNENHEAWYKINGQSFEPLHSETKINLGANNDGTQNLTLKVSNGTDTEMIATTISIGKMPEADFFFDTRRNQQVAFINYSKGAVNYQWHFSDGKVSREKQPLHTFGNSGKASALLVVSSGDGCLDSMTKDFYLDRRPQLQIPNTFTPNGDGTNDKFVIKIGEVKFYHLIIRDEYGKKVFESNDTDRFWNGSVNNAGKDCTKGKYEYMLRYKYPGQDEIQVKKGALYLMR